MAIDKLVQEPGLTAVLNVSDQARQQAETLLALLAESGDNSPESQSAIANQQKLLLAHVAQLRGLHRRAYHTARDIKGTTADARHEVDRLHLQLQNLYYEQRHLQGEIVACESYE